MTPRLPKSPTQRIDRDREVQFLYGGKSVKGLAGDTIATALFADGVRIFSRSMKYHRPRGLYNLDGWSSHCLMTVDGEPNVRACKTPLRQGMRVKPQNVIGTPEWDLMSVMRYFSFAMPVGFYYKVFHKPAWIWPYAQEVIRRAAGLGKLDPSMPDGTYENRYHNAEVCVIGGGPAGMQAALAAAGAGVRVVLLEATDHLGGALAYRTAPISVDDETAAYQYGLSLADEVLARENIEVLLSAPATSIYQSNLVTAVQKGGPADHFRECYHEIRAGSTVVATGAIERPLIFQNNDIPGIMQGSCAQQLIHTYGLKPGSRAVVSGCRDSMLEVAVDLAGAGIEVAAVADTRSSGYDEALASRLAGLDIPFLPAHSACKASGFKTLSGATVRSLSNPGSRTRFRCDLLVASAGEVGLSQLLQVAGAKMAYDSSASRYMPVELPPGVYAAGRVMALEDVKAIAMQGKVAGLEALRGLGVDVAAELGEAKEMLEALRPHGALGAHGTHRVHGALGALGALAGHGGHETLEVPPGPGQCSGLAGTGAKGRKCFVCLDEDVTLDQIGDAMAEGFDQTELVKRYTTVGTGPSQSYLSGTNLPLAVAANKCIDPGEVLPTTVRPPVVPTSMAVLAGRRHAPVKHTPLHGRQEALGGAFRLAGAWDRVRYFGEKSARAEIENVRKNVGFIDVSTLGKFRLFGPDALKLLQRVYAGDMSTVVEGKLKYAAMCNEEGIIIDDGVVTKTGENDYFLTTSTARAGNTAEWLGFHSREEHWEAYLVNLTDSMAGINLAGPRSRDVLKKLTDENVSNEAMPYMAIRRMVLCGEIEALVMRVGFVGELSYEIHVPSSLGPTLHDALMEAGKAFDIKPFGLEAQSVLRLEKGHVIIGVETDNHSTLHDIGMSRAWDRSKTDSKTVGAPALRFTEKQSHRQKLVGFMMENPVEAPTDGSVVVAGGAVRGRICSSRYSDALGQSIGMALVDPELAVMGGALHIYSDGKLVKGRVPAITTVKARIVPTPFYDPEGTRLRS